MLCQFDIFQCKRLPRRNITIVFFPHIESENFFDKEMNDMNKNSHFFRN